MEIVPLSPKTEVNSHELLCRSRGTSICQTHSISYTFIGEGEIVILIIDKYLLSESTKHLKQRHIDTSVHHVFIRSTIVEIARRTFKGLSLWRVPRIGEVGC